MPYFGSINDGGTDAFIPDGTIQNKELVNSTVNYGGVTLSLGSTDATPAFDLTNATNYPSSSLTGTISLSQLNSTDVGTLLRSNADDITTGQIQFTKAGDPASNAGQIFLNGATSNRIDFNTNGVAGPSTSTRSAGTKLVLYPQVSATHVDYALGIESNTLWYSVPTTSSFHRWYGGTTPMMTLSGSNLDVAGTITASRFIGDSDYNIFMGTDAGGSYDASTGTACRNIAIGLSAGYSIVDSNINNVYIGTRAGKCDSCLYNTFVGFEAGQCWTEGCNTFLGVGAAIGNGTGFYNTAVGTFVGPASGSNICGNYNVYFGYAAGVDPFIGCGCYNLFFGRGTGRYVDGHNNVFLGNYTGAGDGGGTGCHNIGLGAYAGCKFGTGSHNITIGRNAGLCNVSGCYNAFLGACAGFCNTTQSNSIAIGSSAGRANAANNNIYLGQEAGWNSTRGSTTVTGTDNFFAGVGAGGSTTSGSYNNFFGDQAGYSNCTGSSNNFFGNQVGYFNTSGNYNNFIGLFAGYFNTTGCYNNFFGWQAGYYNTTGAYNNFFGTGAGLANTTGNYNNFIGYFAGSSNTTGSNNNFIGYQGGYFNTTGYHNIFFGNRAGKCNTTGSSNVFLGDEAGCHNTCGSCNIAIGYRAGCCSSFDGTITDSTCDNIFIGRYSGYCSCGHDNLSIGTLAGWYSNGFNNIFLGCLSGGGFNSTGSYNIFIGCRAGNGNTTGSVNIAIGDHSGSSNTCGCYNIFMGCSAGRGNTTASHNIYIGRNAACRNSTGSCNIFMGRYAGACIGLFDKNMEQSIIMGDCAGFRAGITCCGSSNRNVWIGSYAGAFNECAGGSTSETYVGNFAGAYTQGAFNTFIGTYSGTYCKNCYISDNIAIGRDAGYRIKGDCNIVIGRTVRGGCFNNILIGNCAGNGTFSGLVFVEASSNHIVIGNCDITNFYTKMRSAASAGTNVEWCSTTCELIADTSSCRFKHNIRPFLKGIEVINNIEPVRYKSNDDPEGPDHVGFIAEQIDEIGLTEFVSYDVDDTPYSVSYGKMVSLLTNGIKELSAENQELRERIIALENEVGIST